MRKLGMFLLAALTLVLLLAGCAQEQYFHDGTYTAEFEDFDGRGYKDYIRVTVKDKVVTSIEYDAVNEEGALKSADEKYASDMQKVQDTYPDKYTADLINQYMEAQSISGVDALAGATYSSDAFTALFTELEKSMLSGDTETVTVANIPTI